MAHTLPPLPYAYDALEPHYDAQTLEIHHGKHHAAYVRNLNTALEGHPAEMAKSIDELLGDLDAVPEAIRTAVRNHGGGHANHALFWTIMAPGGGGKPSGSLAKAIDKAFGSYDEFKDELSLSAAKQFGSGWAWLVVDASEGLKILSTSNQITPVSVGQKPLITLDVWEHAYYLKYQNRRAEWIAAWWNLVHWDEIAKRYEEAMF
ncbi:MAG TPA: superoxide dismutase [Anaerolineae bacterium]|nr:superoxide dismutase [Anaerolineae bacterium]